MSELKFFQPYQSVYVDMKLPEIAEIRRNRYDTAKGEYDKLRRAVGSIRVAPKDEPVKNQLLQDFDTQMSGNVNFETLMPTIQDMTTRFATDTDLMDAMDSYATFQKEQEMMNKIIMEKGKGSMLDFNNTFAKDANGNIIYNPDGTPQVINRFETHNTKRDGIYTVGAEQKLDWDAQGLNLLQGIKSDPIILRAARGAGISDYELKAFFEYGKQVSDTKIKDLAEILTNEFVDNTAEGQQMLRDYMQLRLNPTTKNTYTDAEAREEIQRFLTNLAMKQEGSELSYLGNKMYVEAQKAAMTAPTTPDILYTGTFQVDDEKAEALNFEERYKDFTRVIGADYMFDPQGNWIFTPDQQAKMQAAAAAAGRGRGPNMEAARVDELLANTGGNWAQISAEDLENNMVGIAAWVMDPKNKWNTPEIRKSFVMPDGTPMNDREFINNMGKILGQGENLRRAMFQPGQRETVASELFSSIQPGMMIYTDDDPGQGISLEDFSRSLSNFGGYDDPGMMRDLRAALSNTANGNLSSKGVDDQTAPVASISLNTSGENAGTFNIRFTSADKRKYKGKEISINVQPYENFEGGAGFQIAKNSYNLWKTRDLDKTTEMNIKDLGILDSSMSGKGGKLIFYNQIIPNAGVDPATNRTWTDVVPAMKMVANDGTERAVAGWQWMMQLENASIEAIARKNNFVGQGLRATYDTRTMLKN